MKRVILIHGWEEKPDGHWFPWLKRELQSKNWEVETPEMPNTKNPKLAGWMEKLESLKPDENTVLVGHSLACALVLKFLEKKNVKIRCCILVAAWDWLMEDVRKFHETFFKDGFDYEKIKEKDIPIYIVNSTTDPWIDFERSKNLTKKVNAEFVGVEKAGHFMDKDGFMEFPQILKLILEIE